MATMVSRTRARKPQGRRRIKDHPLKAKVGDTVRMYFGVGGRNFISSFHVVGEVMDEVRPWGALASVPTKDVQTIVVPPRRGDGGAMPFACAGQVHPRRSRAGQDGKGTGGISGSQRRAATADLPRRRGHELTPGDATAHLTLVPVRAHRLGDKCGSTRGNNSRSS